MHDDEAPARPRADAVPNANSPALLTHLLEMVARGVRSVRGLQEALGVDPRTVRYYLQAGAWLGWLRDAEPGGDPLLTPTGLAYVYGGPHRRALYAAAVEAQPFLRALLDAHDGALPEGRQLEVAIARAEPGLAAATVTRRASAVRGLCAPWFDERAARALREASDALQLSLPLGQHARPEVVPALTRLSGSSFSPDIYRYLLAFLLDHGELTLGHVRGLLDRAGAEDTALGAYVDLALGRGDAVRVEERLVATAEAVARRELAQDVAGVILSDRGWRAHLEDVRARAPGERPPAPGRFRLWDERLFGRALDPGTVDAELARVLRDRSLQTWPLTGAAPGSPPEAPHAPFLDVWQQPGLLVTLPPSLAQLWEGVAGVNRRLRNARHRADAVGLPSLAYVPVAAFGGLLHPGETLPRAIADGRTLRQRLVMNAPYPAMVAALLLAHRKSQGQPEILQDRGGWWVRLHRRRIGPLLEVCDRFAASRGWHPCRRASGVEAGTLLDLAERAGVAVRADGRAMLEDTWFAQLRTDEEESLVGAALDGLADAMTAHLDDLHATAGRWT